MSRRLRYSGPRFLADLNNPGQGREVSNQEFEQVLSTVPEHEKARYTYANDYHYDPSGAVNYEELVRILGPNYQELFRQLGPNYLISIFNQDPILFRKLRPVNPNDPSVQFLEQVLDGHLKLLDRDSLRPCYYRLESKVFAIQEPGKMSYSAIVE